MDYLHFSSFVAVDDVVAVEVTLQHHPNRRQLLLMVVIHGAAAVAAVGGDAAVAHHGNCHVDLAQNIVADYLVAMHDNVAVVDNFDFPVIFN